MEQITLLASIPPIQSGIKIADLGGRIQLDVPEDNMPELLKLVAYGRGKVLRVTIEVLAEQKQSPASQFTED